MSKAISESDLPKLIDSLKDREFYGKLSVEFNRGQAKLIRIEETKLVQGATQNGQHNRQDPR